MEIMEITHPIISETGIEFVRLETVESIRIPELHLPVSTNHRFNYDLDELAQNTADIALDSILSSNLIQLLERDFSPAADNHRQDSSIRKHIEYSIVLPDLHTMPICIQALAASLLRKIESDVFNVARTLPAHTSLLPYQVGYGSNLHQAYKKYSASYNTPHTYEEYILDTFETYLFNNKAPSRKHLFVGGWGSAAVKSIPRFTGTANHGRVKGFETVHMTSTLPLHSNNVDMFAFAHGAIALTTQQLPTLTLNQSFHNRRTEKYVEREKIGLRARTYLSYQMDKLVPILSLDMDYNVSAIHEEWIVDAAWQ